MIRSEIFTLSEAEHARPGEMTALELLPGEVKGVSTELLCLAGPAKKSWKADDGAYVVLLFLEGSGQFKSGDEVFTIRSPSIVRVPFPLPWHLAVPESRRLCLLKVTKALDQADKAEMARKSEAQAVFYARELADCPAYKEDIKSARTINRMLLDEGLVPRFCMGSVETAGPDKVANHIHEMLDQLFLGLPGCLATCHADGESAMLTHNCLMHVPLGSNHSVSVAEGDKLHYIWMDFFSTLEGQEYMRKQHKVEPEQSRVEGL